MGVVSDVNVTDPRHSKRGGTFSELHRRPDRPVEERLESVTGVGGRQTPSFHGFVVLPVGVGGGGDHW